MPCHAILSEREIGLAPGEFDLSQQSTHPDETSLLAFAAGALAEEDLNAVAEHVGQCKKCRERVDELGARDDFVERLQAASASMSESPERAGERRGAARLFSAMRMGESVGWRASAHGGRDPRGDRSVSDSA